MRDFTPTYVGLGSWPSVRPKSLNAPPRMATRVVGKADAAAYSARKAPSGVAAVSGALMLSKVRLTGSLDVYSVC